MKPARTWIVVADGARARVFLNEGAGNGLGAAPIYEAATTLAPNRDLKSDRPGRSHAASGRRHGMEPTTDWHEAEKEHFAKSLADYLEREAASRSFDRLILAAPPKVLGALRGQLGTHAARLVIGEVAKDLTHLAPKELHDHFQGDFNI